MRQYNKYLIKNADQFDPENFPAIDEELDNINEQVASLPSLFKADIIISFLKDHSLQKDWIKANPELTELVTSGSLFTGSVESLFESCRDNPVFRQHLETYLTNSISGIGSPAGSVKI